MHRTFSSALRVLALASIAVAGCAVDRMEVASSTTAIAEAEAADAGAGVEVTQLPPIGAAASIEEWLAAGHYKSWACEDAPHAARPPSGHSPNRICSNALASGHGAGEYPIGSASVKELYDDEGTRIVGYAVARKVGAGGGEAWHWFERLEGAGVIANGLGTEGTPKRVCARCHARAGAATFGHDQVFTQVP